MARNNALSLANEANRRSGGVASMSLEEAEKLASEADKFDADLDYLEAATKDGGAGSTQGPVVEDSPNVLKEVKNIKKKKATRKMKAKAKYTAAAAAEGLVQEEQGGQEGKATLQEQPEAEAKATGQAKAELEVTDVVCSFSSFIVLLVIIPSILTCLPNRYTYYAHSSSHKSRAIFCPNSSEIHCPRMEKS